MDSAALRRCARRLLLPVQYDLNPLYSSINGAGKTIGIIDESNVDLGVVNAYHSVFGLTSNTVQVVLDGGDPGQNSSIVESYLDVELAGAVAPAATVDLTPLSLL